MKMNSKGITIIEIMIGTVLFSIIALSVTYFISTGTNTCKEAEKTITLQEESQVIMNQLLNISVEANSIETKDLGGNVCLLVMNTDKGTKETKIERILYFKKSSGELYFYEVDATTDVDTLETVKNEINGRVPDITYGQLLGEYLSDFAVDFDKTSQTITFELTLGLSGKEMKTKDSIRLRNKYVDTEHAFVEI